MAVRLSRLLNVRCGRRRYLILSALVALQIIYYLYAGGKLTFQKSPVKNQLDTIDIKQDTRMHTVSVVKNKLNPAGVKTHKDQRRPLLTLMTSIKDTPDRDVIHRNTIKNWAALSPWVRPVLYIASNDSEKWRNVTLGYKEWRVRTAPREIKGIPVLRDLFLDAMSQTEDATPFYGFANADNLFDLSLVETLKCILNIELESLLVVGERTNVDIQNITSDVGNLDNVQKLKNLGSRVNTYTHDYFITSPRMFPWERVLDFVLGRPGYDNWLIAKSLEWNITLIDTTPSIFDLHQTGSDGNKAGWRATDPCVNLDLIGPHHVGHGRSMCATWETVPALNNTVALQKKKHTLVHQCQPKPYVYSRGLPCTRKEWQSDS